VTPERAAGGRRRELATWLGAIAMSIAILGVASAIAPALPVDPRRSIGEALAAYAIAFGAIGAITIAVAACAPSLGARGLWVLAPIAGALVGVAAAGEQRGAPTGALAVVALLGAGGTLAGAAIGARIQHPGHLSIVAIASSIADLWSVLSPGAPSATVAASAPLLSVLALSFPMPGTDAIEPLLGIGDVVFVALYLAAARAHRLGIARTIVAMASGLAVTAMVVTTLRIAIPALPFLGAAMLIAHPAARLPPPHERTTAAIALGALVVVVIALVVVRR
jgi:hypothetical protein